MQLTPSFSSPDLGDSTSKNCKLCSRSAQPCSTEQCARNVIMRHSGSTQSLNGVPGSKRSSGMIRTNEQGSTASLLSSLSVASLMSVGCDQPPVPPNRTISVAATASCRVDPPPKPANTEPRPLWSIEQVLDFEPDSDDEPGRGDEFMTHVACVQLMPLASHGEQPVHELSGCGFPGAAQVSCAQSPRDLLGACTGSIQLCSSQDLVVSRTVETQTDVQFEAPKSDTYKEYQEVLRRLDALDQKIGSPTGSGGNTPRSAVHTPRTGRRVMSPKPDMSV